MILHSPATMTTNCHPKNADLFQNLGSSHAGSFSIFEKVPPTAHQMAQIDLIFSVRSNFGWRFQLSQRQLSAPLYAMASLKSATIQT
jgi:hypothetical protein